MQRPEGQVKDFLEGIDHEIRRRDAMTLVDLMESATGEEPRVWESILGFGQYDYRYESGREGTAPAAGFSPRNAATTIYLVDGVGDTTISSRTWARTPPVSAASMSSTWNPSISISSASWCRDHMRR